MRQRTGSSLVQVMAFRLLGAKPLPEQMMTFAEMSSANWRPFCPGGRYGEITV